MKLSLSRRLLAATGLIYGLLNLITLIALPPPPAAGTPAQEIQEIAPSPALGQIS